MTIEIGGQLLMLTVPFNRQNAVRDTEKAVASLLASWKKRFPDKNDRELLAMLAYQYASFYFDLREGLEKDSMLADDCLARIDSYIPKSD